LSQITRTTPLRRTTLHLSQIFFTDDLTFICPSPPASPAPYLYRNTIRPRLKS
jgi:hypothetical protein